MTRGSANPICDRELDDTALLAVIDQVYAESRGTYGSPRVHADPSCPASTL